VLSMRISSIIIYLLYSLAFQAIADDLVSNHLPIKIVCIGDSITQGGNFNNQEFTFRLPLYLLIKQKGINVDFIGTRNHGLNDRFRWPDDFDPDHEGFYGATTDQVRRELISDLPRLPAPDVALIDLGSNDQGKDIQTAVVAPLRDIVSQLRARNPQVKILIIQIPGMFRNFAMHFWVWRMAQELSQPKSPVITIPLYLGWDTKGDTFEGSHPNISGQNKMANAIFAELEPIIQTIYLQNGISK